MVSSAGIIPLCGLFRQWLVSCPLLVGVVDSVQLSNGKIAPKENGMLREIGLVRLILTLVTAAAVIVVLTQTTEFGPLAGGFGVTDETALSWGQGADAAPEATEAPAAEATDEATEEPADEEEEEADEEAEATESAAEAETEEDTEATAEATDEAAD